MPTFVWLVERVKQKPVASLSSPIYRHSWPCCARNCRKEIVQIGGVLQSATGLLLSSTLPATVGDQCSIEAPDGREVLAEVIGFRNDVTYLVPYETPLDARPGLRVMHLGHGMLVPVGDGLMGRVVDGLGRPMDGRGPLTNCQLVPASRASPEPLDRARIRQPFVTGLRAVDGPLTCGKDQRVGVFSGSGVGKSTVLGEIAKGAEADDNVVVLVGERGREVRSFLEDSLGPKGLARSVVVVATCDEAPQARVAFEAARAEVVRAESRMAEAAGGGLESLRQSAALGMWQARYEQVAALGKAQTAAQAQARQAEEQLQAASLARARIASELEARNSGGGSDSSRREEG